MITLNGTAGDSLQGAAGAATTVNIVIEGMELTSGVETYKILTAAGTQLSVSAGPLYAPSAGTQSFIRTIFLNNTNGSTAYTVDLFINGTGNGSQILNATLPAGGSATWDTYDGWSIYDSNGYLTTATRGWPVTLIAGNTSGTTASISTGTLNVYGGNNITLSQVANAITVSAGGNANLSLYDNMHSGNASQSYAIAYHSLHIFPLFNGEFPGNMTVNSLYFDMTGTAATSNTSTMSAASIVMRVGIYSVISNNILTLVNSASTYVFSQNNTFSVSSDGSNQIIGQRWVMFTQNNWSGSAVPTLSPVHYWVGYNFAVSYNNAGTTVTTANLSSISLSLYGQSNYNTMVRSGTMGAASAANPTFKGNLIFGGVYSSSTNGIPPFIYYDEINKQSGSGNFIPHLLVNNLTGDW